MSVDAVGTVKSPPPVDKPDPSAVSRRKAEAAESSQDEKLEAASAKDPNKGLSVDEMA